MVAMTWAPIPVWVWVWDESSLKVTSRTQWSRFDLREQIIQRTRADQTLSALSLVLAARFTRRPIDSQQCVSFHKETHPLHTQSDTLE